MKDWDDISVIPVFGCQFRIGDIRKIRFSGVMINRVIGILLLLTASLTSILAGNAPVCTIGMVNSSDSLAVVPVRVRDFKNIGACDLKIGFNTSVASFEKITFGSGVSFSAFNVNKELINEGIIRCGGYFNAGVTLNDESIFLNIHFKKKNTGSSALTFIDDQESFSCLFYDSNLNSLNDVPYADHYVNGLLSFTGDRVAPVTVIPDVSACQGDIVDLPVIVRNFSNIGMVTLSIGYDHNVLKNPVFTNTSGALSLSPDLSVPGLIKVVGYNMTQEGESLPDGAVFFTLSFTYTGGESVVNFIHTSSADCQYKTPSPGFIPIGDNPKPAFFSDGSVTAAPFSGYALSLTAPGEMCYGETAEISVNLVNNTPSGQCALGNGMLKITATGPGDVTFRFNDGKQPFVEFINSGYWGPSGGFLLSPEFLLTLQGNIDFSSPGDYSILLRLEDAASGSLIDGITETWNISIVPLPVPTLAGPDEVCAFSASHTYVTEAGKLNYLWTVSGGKITAGGGTADHSVVVTWDKPGNGLLSVNYKEPGSGCSPAVPSALPVKIDLCSVVVKGSVKYLNEVRSPLKDVKLFLTSEGDTAYTATTDQYGDYEFPSVLPGEYSVKASIPHDGKGAVNSLDAGTLKKWRVEPFAPLEKVRFLAGDADENHSLSMGDASLINNFFLQKIPHFYSDPSVKWCFGIAGDYVTENKLNDNTYPVIYVGTDSVIRDFFLLTAGDFNMSCFPGDTFKVSSSGSLNLQDGQVVIGSPGEESVIHFSALSDVKVGAFSLILDYPHELIDIIAVFRGTDAFDTIPFNVVNNQLRIGWYSNDPIILQKDQELFSIRVKVRDEAENGSQIRFSLADSPQIELADENMKIINESALAVSPLNILATQSRLPSENTGFNFKLYPNPASNYVKMEFCVPEKGLGKIRILDPLGKLVQIHTLNSSSKQEFSADVSDWKPGMYFFVIEYYNHSKYNVFYERIIIWHHGL